MKTIRSLRFGIITALLVLCSAAVALADPPSRVARLQYVSGEISVQPGGVDEWVAAAVNRPLTTADRLWADKDSRAELHLGGALMRINSESSLTLTNVSDEAVQVELHQGTLNLRIRHLYDGEVYEVDTQNLAFTITKSGEYRFDVDPNADTTVVTVWKGEGEANGEGRGVRVRRGEQARFTNGNSLTNEIHGAPEMDGFDDWCRVRNEREDHSVSARYVSPDVIGAEDLDDYGTWRVVPAYGPVWVPTVAVGWAPYHYGHWVWIDPWGWTWVDDAPWGFAPCHYGRWVFYSGYWGWVPGPMRVRPVYAPALVAWVGGAHWGVGLSFGAGGGVGWFPLGYGEPYVPSYHVSRNYFQNVNVSNTKIVNITNVTNNYYNTTNINNTNITKITYVNQTVPGAMTAVSRNVMTTSQPVAKAAVQIPQGELHAAPVAVAAPVAPTKTSVLGLNARSATSMPPTNMVSKPVVAKLAPPPKPVPFAAKQEALAANPGRPLDTQAEQQIRANIARQPVPPVKMGGPAAAQPVTPSAGVKPVAPAPGTAQPVIPSAGAKPVTPTGVAQPVTPTTGTKPVTPAPGVATPQPRQNFPARAIPRPPVKGTDLPQPLKAPGGQAKPDVSQPVFNTPVHAVPRPPQTRTEEQPPAANPVAPVAHPPVSEAPVARPPESKPTNVETPQPVARPVAQPVERPVAQPVERPVPKPPETVATPQREVAPQPSRPAQPSTPRVEPVREQPAHVDRPVPRPSQVEQPRQETPRAQPAPQPQRESKPARESKPKESKHEEKDKDKK